MAFSLSFSPEFFYGLNDSKEIEYSDRPLSVRQAIFSLSSEQRAGIARDIFDGDSRFLRDDMILERVIDTDTCTDLMPPVKVWIDREGFYTVLVYDDPSAVQS